MGGPCQVDPCLAGRRGPAGILLRLAPPRLASNRGHPIQWPPNWRMHPNRARRMPTGRVSREPRRWTRRLSIFHFAGSGDCRNCNPIMPERHRTSRPASRVQFGNVDGIVSCDRYPGPAKKIATIGTAVALLPRRRVNPEITGCDSNPRTCRDISFEEREAFSHRPVETGFITPHLTHPLSGREDSRILSATFLLVAGL